MGKLKKNRDAYEDYNNTWTLTWDGGWGDAVIVKDGTEHTMEIGCHKDHTPTLMEFLRGEGSFKSEVSAFAQDPGTGSSTDGTGTDEHRKLHDVYRCPNTVDKHKGRNRARTISEKHPGDMILKDFEEQLKSTQWHADLCLSNDTAEWDVVDAIFEAYKNTFLKTALDYNLIEWKRDTGINNIRDLTHVLLVARLLTHLSQ